jgi:hypothetical protein
MNAPVEINAKCILCRPDPIFFNGERERYSVTFFSNFAASTLTAKEMSLAELRDRILSATAARKDALPWLKRASSQSKLLPPRLTRARNVTKPSARWLLRQRGWLFHIEVGAKYSASLRRGTARPRCSIRRCLNAHQAAGREQEPWSADLGIVALCQNRCAVGNLLQAVRPDR